MKSTAACLLLRRARTMNGARIATRKIRSLRKHSVAHVSCQTNSRAMSWFLHNPPPDRVRSRAPLMASVGFAVGFAGLGLLWHVDTVHADSIRSPTKPLPPDTPNLDYLREAAASHCVYDDPGIQRFDSIVVPSRRFTAEPETTTTDSRPGDFLVMGSDGLWDTISSPSEGTSSHHHMIASDFTIDAPYDKDKVVDRDSLPVIHQEDKTAMYPWWRGTKKFVNVDADVAAHLARNALGDADQGLTLGLLAMTPPRSRRYR
ncbi:hypothetical protein EYR36_000063 [Pleurotus pulmonarius]|nr:hypothetical protein EYR36_000063 [Pleurotus pulmonarius]